MRFEWREINELTHLATHAGRPVAIAYAIESGEYKGRRIFEFWSLPLEDVGQEEVLFGVSEDVGTAWDTRWDRAHDAVEWLLTRPERPPNST